MCFESCINRTYDSLCTAVIYTHPAVDDSPCETLVAFGLRDGGGRVIIFQDYDYDFSCDSLLRSLFAHATLNVLIDRTYIMPHIL